MNYVNNLNKKIYFFLMEYSYSKLNTSQKYEKGIVKQFLKKFNLFKIEDSIFWAFMTVYTGVFFTCETLQSSNLIKSKHHNYNYTTGFAYNLLFVWLVTMFLLKEQDLASNVYNADTILYWLFANLGGVGFALLGEVPFLSTIIITKDWWKHLSPAAWVCVTVIAIIVIFIGCSELKYSCRDGRFKRSLLTISLVALSYTIILALLITGKAKDIHYHVHHAIFAGVLSLWFTDWKNKLVMIMNAILMGVVVEGINFFGINELYLFLTSGEVAISFRTSAVITFVFYFFILIIYVINKFR
tara:strand:+ start:86 stop:982 length:897 start_codon:yes stop_codon:yes gene_type:complete